MTYLVSLKAGETQTLVIPERVPLQWDVEYPEVLFEVLAPALFVDISHPYDADTTNNHGESVIALCRNVTPTHGGDPIEIQINLGNVTTQPLVYVLSVEPNTVAAQLIPAQVEIAPGGAGYTSLFCTMPFATPANTSVTVIARDLQGNVMGGITVLLYFK